MHLKIYSHGYEIHELTSAGVLDSISREPLFFFAFCEGECLVMLCQHFSLLPYYSYKFFTHTGHAPQNIVMDMKYMNLPLLVFWTPFH